MTSENIIYFLTVRKGQRRRYWNHNLKTAQSKAHGSWPQAKDFLVQIDQTQSNSVEFLDIMRGVKKSNIFTVLSFKKDMGDSQ